MLNDINAYCTQTKLTNKPYTTTGSVRGCCGHHHLTLKAAFDCLERDKRACAKLGGGAYSDRIITRRDGRPFNDDERREIDWLELAAGERP